MQLVHLDYTPDRAVMRTTERAGCKRDGPGRRPIRMTDMGRPNLKCEQTDARVDKTRNSRNSDQEPAC
ncbi:hypothetical protein L596_001027 [Steinernema carpocapsae]|uniref:Uncharacterized protein n=1 Tax=Steinernema carpocapsae TaxID=34508 RepID=A0A4U8UP26_STECR|nr:hypothetical protein L596_001027 [Steinernema carpocapsae]